MPAYDTRNDEGDISPPPQLFTNSGSPVVPKGTGKYLADRIKGAPHEKRTDENRRHWKPDGYVFDGNPYFRREAHETLRALLEKQGIGEGGELSDVDLGLALSAFDAAYLVLDDAVRRNAEQARDSPFQPVESLEELGRALNRRLGGDDALYYTGFVEKVRVLYAQVSRGTTELRRQLQIALGVEEKDTPADLPVQRRKRVLGLISFLGNIFSSEREQAASAPVSVPLRELYGMFDKTLDELIAAQEERDRQYGTIADLRARVERLTEDKALQRHEAEVIAVANLLSDGRVGIEPTYLQYTNPDLIGTKREDGSFGADSIEPI